MKINYIMKRAIGKRSVSNFIVHRENSKGTIKILEGEVYKEKNQTMSFILQSGHSGSACVDNIVYSTLTRSSAQIPINMRHSRNVTSPCKCCHCVVRSSDTSSDNFHFPPQFI